MKVTIDFPTSVVEPLIQAHLEESRSVQDQIVQAVRFYISCRRIQQKGNAIGFGQKDNMRRYNTLIGPDDEILFPEE